MSVQLEPGTLLVSVPQMLDPNFMHTVLLICEHSPEGAYGLVLNRPTGLDVGRIFDEHPLLRGLHTPVFTGGPVGRDSFQFVHCAPEEIPGGHTLAGELTLGGDLDDLARYLVGHAGDPPVRLFIGYSGWGPGQLEGEIEVGSWVPAVPDPKVLFGTDAEREEVWRRVLRGLGPEGEGLAQMPPDASWN